MEYKKYTLENNSDEVRNIVVDFHKKILEKHGLDDESVVSTSYYIKSNDPIFFDIKEFSSETSAIIKEIFAINILLTESKIGNNKKKILNNLDAISDLISFQNTNDIKYLINLNEKIKNLDFSRTNLSKKSYLGSKKGIGIAYTRGIEKNLVEKSLEIYETLDKFINDRKKELISKNQEKLIEDMAVLVSEKEEKLNRKDIKIKNLTRENEELFEKNEENEDIAELLIDINTENEKKIENIEKEYAELLKGGELIRNTKINVNSEGKIEKVLSDGVIELILDKETSEATILQFQNMVDRMKALIKETEGKADEKKYRDAFTNDIKEGEEIILAIKNRKFGTEEIKKTLNWFAKISGSFSKLAITEQIFLVIAFILTIGVTTAVVVGGGVTATKFIVDKFSGDKRKKYDSEKRLKTIKSMNKKLELLKKEYKE